MFAVFATLKAKSLIENVVIN